MIQGTNILTPETVEIIRTVVAWLAGIGIVVDLTPGIKLQPVRWILRQLGNLLLSDAKTELKQVNERLDALQKDLEDHKVDSWRCEILDFSNSCINHRRHTKEEFDHIIDTCDRYGKYIDEHNLRNGQIDIAEGYIKEIYEECMKQNDFIAEPVEEGSDKK